jgi:hypothetical protein
MVWRETGARVRVTVGALAEGRTPGRGRVEKQRRSHLAGCGKRDDATDNLSQSRDFVTQGRVLRPALMAGRPVFTPELPNRSCERCAERSQFVPPVDRDFAVCANRKDRPSC